MIVEFLGQNMIIFKKLTTQILGNGFSAQYWVINNLDSTQE